MKHRKAGLVRTVNALRKEAEPKKYFMNRKLNKEPSARLLPITFSGFVSVADIELLHPIKCIENDRRTKR